MNAIGCMNSVLLEMSEAPFLVFGGPLSPEDIGRLPTLPKVKAGSGE